MELKSSPANVKIGVRPETREKFARYRKQTRLKFVDIADLAIDALMKAQERKGRKQAA